jgi:hypothetical protein
MKTPRIHDFDPEAAERQLGTPLNGMPAIEKPRPRPQTSVVRPTTTSNGPQKKPQVVTTTREYAQRTFNVYEDQIAYLTKVSLEERLAGRDVSMNDMVREALDLYITHKTSKK